MLAFSLFNLLSCFRLYLLFALSRNANMVPPVNRFSPLFACIGPKNVGLVRNKQRSILALANSRGPTAKVLPIDPCKMGHRSRYSEHDPLRCLRCSSIGIGIWTILYCLIQFGLLGWQVQVVKEWQWYWENRELPATGAIDQYQARFPGLYAIYTETPERRRVNAMYAIVLIAVGLTIVHLPMSAAMLYGAVKRLPNWILPWFFTEVPLIMLCTAYSILWWSGDIFNEQLTFSVVEFTMSLAVNGICVVVVFLYYQRLRGKLFSERVGNNGHAVKELRIAPRPQRESPQTGRIPRGATSRSSEWQKLPSWIEALPEKPPPAIRRKLLRKARKERELVAKLDKQKEEKLRKQRRAKSAPAQRNAHFQQQRQNVPPQHQNWRTPYQ